VLFRSIKGASIKGKPLYICRDCVAASLYDLANLDTQPRVRTSSSVRKIYYADEIGIKCSFCQRKREDVRAIARYDPRNKHHICDECVLVCFDIVLTKVKGERREHDESFYKPLSEQESE